MVRFDNFRDKGDMTMKFMVTWRVHDDKRTEVLGMWSSLTPKQRSDAGEGVKIVGRWHDLAAGMGVLIAETDNLTALNRYLGQWNPFMDVEVVPVLDDEESAAAAKLIIADLSN
jgi:hypothetical protein